MCGATWYVRFVPIADIRHREGWLSRKGMRVYLWYRVMYHCGRGPRPNIFDGLGSLEPWVEMGAPPDRSSQPSYADDNVDQLAGLVTPDS